MAGGSSPDPTSPLPLLPSLPEVEAAADSRRRLRDDALLPAFFRLACFDDDLPFCGDRAEAVRFRDDEEALVFERLTAAAARVDRRKLLRRKG